MTDFDLPSTRYATSGDVNIAYQTMGDGPVDLIVVPGFMSHIEFMHEAPVTPRLCAAFRRLPASLRSTNGAKVYPIEHLVPPR